MPAFCIGLVALVWTALAYQTAYERDAQIAHREEEHDNLARLFEEHVRGVLAAASVALRDVESEYRRQGARLDLERFLDERPELRHYLNIAAVDGDGDVVLNRTSFSKRLNIRETESFQHHLKNTSLDLFMAKPRIGKASGRWTLFVTRRMNRPDGGFDGMTSVGVDPEYFSGFYDQMLLGTASIIMLIGRDGVVRAMRSNGGAQAGQDMMQSPLFTTHLAAHETGHGIWSGVPDSVTRLYSYRSVKGFPLVVVVGSAKDVVLWTVEQRRRVYFWWAGGISIAIIGFAALVAMQSVRRKRYEEALRKHGLRFRRVVETSNDGFWVVDREGRLRDVNESYMRRSGYTRKELLGMRVSEFEAKETPADTAAHIETIVSKGGEVFETLHRAKNGAVWPVEIAATHRSDNPGQILCFLRDITERKRAEQELRKNTELARLLEDLARTVNEAVSPEAATNICLRRICEHGNWTLGHVAAFARGQSAGLTETSSWHPRDCVGRYAKFIGYSDSFSYNAPTGRFTAVALRERRPVWIEDLSRVAGFGRNAVAVKHGLRAGLALPVIVNGEVTAFLEFFADTPRPADPELIAATESVASMLARLIERERALNALREREHLLRLVSESVPAMIAYFDAELRCRFANGAYCEFHHIDPQRVIGKTLREITGEDTYRVISPSIDLIKQGKPVTLRRQARTAAGEVRHVEIHRVPDLSPEGAFLGYYAMVLDITERVRAEEVRAQLAAIVEHSGDAIWSRSLDGEFLSWNAAATRLFGWTREEMIGRDGSLLVPQERLHEREMVKARLARGEHAFSYETVRLRKDGTTVEVEARASAIRDGDGNLASIAVTMNDITERKLAEQARNGLEAQLREAQKLEAVGTLAGGIAHDFNNILGAIIGNAELARQDVGAGHRALVSLEEISKASQRAKELVQRILTFSRRQPQQLLVQPLHPVVEEAVKLLRATLPAGVELAAAMCDTPVYVHADATQVQQVLLNLCTNAWHAMEGRAGRIEIGLEEVMLDAAAAGALSSVLQPGFHACVSVRDNGCGMDAATQARVFEPFFTTKAVDQGTGLGLSVVHGIVKAHHGAILLESAPGAGTTFRIYFPAVAEPRAPALPEAAAPGPVPGGGQHVLYVDDDEAMVFLVTRMLEGFGYRVSGHESAEDALAAVRATPGEFDLVVTDFNMPGLSGIDVAQELGRLRPELPVVITSGYITEELRTNALQAGVRHLIYKPDTAAELCEVIQRLLATARA